MCVLHTQCGEVGFVNVSLNSTVITSNDALILKKGNMYLSLFFCFFYDNTIIMCFDGVFCRIWLEFEGNSKTVGGSTSAE